MKSNDNPEGLYPGSGSESPWSQIGCTVPVVDAADLFRGRKEVALRFGDAIYHLKITRLGKLILNK